MSEWKEVQLNETCNLIAGYAFKSKDFGNYPTKVLKIADINPPFVSSEKSSGVNLSNYDVDKLDKYIVKKGDYILAMTGATIGKLGRYVSDEQAYLNQRVLKFKPYKSIDSDFLYYVLCGRLFAKYIINHIDSESAQPNISAGTIGKYRFNLPNSETQQKIVSILSSLDSKIENNRKICANLEAQAQALFKHWFIDFAPFKDGKFVESELGMIPEGWRVGTYNDIIQETISGDWGKESLDGNYVHKVACIRGCDFQDVKMGLRGKTPERYILEKNFQSKHFEDKDVLVEISGGTATVSTGRICPISQLLIDKYNGDIICTNFCRLVRPHKGYSSYLYYSWKYKYDKKVMFGYENGTSGIKNFSIKDFTTREPLVLPTLTALNEFEGMIEHIHTQIQNCGSESSKLAVIRDTLLPKLMSGEIKV